MLIDPGHGGKDPGAVSGTIYEKDIVLAYALDLGKIAKAAGRTVRYTRSNDKFIDLNKRSKMVRPNEILISCHVNSVSNPDPSGCSVWYHKDIKESYKLAVEIFELIMATNLFKKYSSGVLPDIPRYQSGFAVLREAAKIGARAAVLIEPGFLSNKKDRATLTNPRKRLVLAEAIHDGMTGYLNQK
jgi:N-acetylmuramoyl-L-alanine amidase